MKNIISSSIQAKILRTVALTVLSAMLFSCAHLGGGLKPPEVTLSDIMVEDVTLFETTIKVRMRVVNKNPQPLEIVGAEGDIHLNNSKMMTVVSGDSKSIPGFGSDVIEATAHASNLKMIPFLAGIISQLQAGEKLKDVDYKASGIIHLAGGGFLSGRVPFKSAGELPMSTVQRLHKGLVNPKKSGGSGSQG